MTEDKRLDTIEVVDNERNGGQCEEENKKKKEQGSYSGDVSCDERRKSRGSKRKTTVAEGHFFIKMERKGKEKHTQKKKAPVSETVWKRTGKAYEKKEMRCY